METTENTVRMPKCPSFESCFAPICPLDEFAKDRIYLTGEPKCKANISTRFRIGKDLANMELNGYVVYHGSPQKVKEALSFRFAPTCVENNG